jgi:mono/diheme cytochrome c family protein
MGRNRAVKTAKERGPVETIRSARQGWLRMPTIVLGALALGVLLAACGSGTAPGGVSSAQIAEGQALYETYCASCHGVEGEGQPNWKTPNQQGVLPAPPHDNSGHTWHHADEQLLELIAGGSGLANSGMPAFGDSLNRSQIEAILAYIKTFWGKRERAYQAEVTQAWESQQE